MNRTELVTRIVAYDRLALLAKARGAELREQLSAEARAELEEQGTAPTWRIPDVATVAASVTHESVYVADPAVWARWVESRYPTEVERVTVVRPAWQAGFLDAALAEYGESGERVVVDTSSGEVVPGLAVRSGGEFGGVSIRVSRDAKAVFDALASDRLARLELEASTPTVLAEVSDG